MPRPPAGPPVQVVWFKKDLRVHDHAPLAEAASRGPVLPLYIYEPEQLHHEEFAGHHLTYLNECLAELDGSLRALGTGLVVRRGEAVAVLEELSELVLIGGLWAHEETGNMVSFQRDRRVRAWARERGVPFVELPQTGVVRRLHDRDGWADIWEERMSAPVVPAPAALRGADLPPGGLCTHAELGVPTKGKTIPPRRRARRPRHAGELPGRARRELHARDEQPAHRRGELLAPLGSARLRHRVAARGGAGDPAAAGGGEGRPRRRRALGALPAFLREPPALALPLYPAAGIRAADGVPQPQPRLRRPAPGHG